MTERVEQRVCIKFYQKLGHPCSETIRIIREVYGDESMSDAQIKEWFRRFENGCTSVVSDLRSGSPTTPKTPEDVERVRALISQNRRLTVREIEEELDIPKATVSEILGQDLGMCRVASKFVPRVLTEDQKNYRVEVAQDNLEAIRNRPEMIKKVITGDELWIHGCDPETETQAAQRDTPPEKQRVKRARQGRSDIKALLTVFFDQEGVVHHEFVPQGQTVDKEYYQEILKRLRDAVKRKRPNSWKSADWILHHENGPAHSSHLIRQFLVKHGIVQLRQPPYSPDLAPCDFWLYPRLKATLNGRLFDDVEEIKTNATKELLAIPKVEYTECFRKWENRWKEIVASNGEYFEGDVVVERN